MGVVDPWGYVLKQRDIPRFVADGIVLLSLYPIFRPEARKIEHGFVSLCCDVSSRKSPADPPRTPRNQLLLGYLHR